MPHFPASLWQMTCLPYEKEMEALGRKAPQLLATKATNSPASTPARSCDPAPDQGLCLALGPSPLPSLASSISFSSVSIPRILGKSSHFFANKRKKKGSLVTLQTPPLGPLSSLRSLPSHIRLRFPARSRVASALTHSYRAASYQSLCGFHATEYRRHFLSYFWASRHTSPCSCLHDPLFCWPLDSARSWLPPLPTPAVLASQGLCAGGPAQLCSWGSASSPVAPSTASLHVGGSSPDCLAAT